MSDFLQLAQAFQLSLKALMMYTGNHPRSRTALEGLAFQVSGWLEDKPSIHIAATPTKVFVDSVPVETKHIHLTNLSRQLSERNISGFILQRGVTAAELEGLLEIMILKPARIEEAGGAAALVESKGLEHIQISQIQYKEVMEGEGGEEDQGGPGAKGAGSDSDSREAKAARAIEAAASAAMAAFAGLGGGAEGIGVGSEGTGRGTDGTGRGTDSTGRGTDGTGRGLGILAAAAAAAAAAGVSKIPSPGTSPKGSATATATPAAAFDLEVLIKQWEEQFGLIPRPSLGQGPGFAAASLGFLAGTPLSIGMGEGFPPIHQVEGLRAALLTLPPETLLSVVAGVDSLPTNPAGLRMGFQSVTAEAFGHAGADLITGEEPWENSKAAIFETLRYMPQSQTMLTALESELRGRGAGLDFMARFQELLSQLQWENQSMEEKVRLALEHDALWSLTLDQRLAFLRSLLDEGRLEALQALLEQILDALAQEDASRRERAAQTLTGVSHWLLNPGLPKEMEGPLVTGLTAHFAWEPLVHIHRCTAEALDLTIGAVVQRGEPGHALELLRELTALCNFHNNFQDWRTAALTGLWGRLSDPICLRKVIELLHTANAETMLNEFMPYLETAGEAAARLLVEVLGEEPDRKRRGRLLEAIRGLGGTALPAIYEGLNSPTWYLVRNTLNLLADIGGAEALKAAKVCLAHADGRVKRAAVRTLWKVGGPTSVYPLLEAFPTVDPETQMEMLFGLGQIKSPAAVPVLTAFVLDRKHQDRLRARALETLGQIGSAKSLDTYVELAKRKGRFFTTAEPTEVRVAACRAMAALGSPQALAALRDTVSGEPRNKDRAALQQVLDHAPVR